MSEKTNILPEGPGAPELPAIRGVIDALCAMWERAEDEPSRDFRASLGEKRAVAIHIHAHHAVRLARALRALDDAGFTNEMIPLIRQIYEDGITAAWLLLTPGSGEVLLKDGARKRQTAQRDMIKLGAADEHSSGYLQTVAVLDELEGVPSAFAFEQRCLALLDGKSLYLTFRVLSAQTHSGLGIADYYAVESDASPIGIELEVRPEFPDRTAYLGIAACLLLLAIKADEHARAKPHRSTQIRNAAKRLGVGTSIPRADGQASDES